MTDINELIVDTAKLLNATLGEQIEIQSKLRQDLHKALIDRSQLTASIINLALNSRDAMPGQGISKQTMSFLMKSTLKLTPRFGLDLT